MVDSDLRTNRRSSRRVERMGRPARRTGRPPNAETPQPSTADDQELIWHKAPSLVPSAPGYLPVQPYLQKLQW